MTQSTIGWRFSTLICGIVIGIVSCLDDARAAEAKGGSEQRGRVIYNLDCSEFFVGTFGPVVPETIDQWVDAHAALGITDMFINVNAQRTNDRSKVWESSWDGYDPNLGDDQPFFAGIDPKRRFETGYFKSVLSLHEQGCDYPKRMIDRTRRNNVKAWISLRMNDGHNGHLPDHPSHSTIWKSHPEWRLAYGLDYEQPEVRKHYMKLIREVCSRYDIDGLELDFVRFWLYFRDGREHEGVKLMTAFVKQAREVTRAAEKRLGHPVELAVRVPTTPWIARRHGLDAVAWAKAGLVDLIISGPFWPAVVSDIPIESWKGLLIGTNVPVAVGLESGMHSGALSRVVTHEEMRGVIISGLHRGADAVYFFNLFTSPYQSWPRKDHDRLVKDAGSYAALREAPRRHVVTMTRPWAAGEPGDDRSLPYTGTHGVFRLHIGPKPRAQQSARVELVVPEHDERLDVSLNGIPCPWSGLVEPEHVKAARLKNVEPKRHIYNVPPKAISDGYNLIEVRAKQGVTITWVEISVR